MLTNAVGVLFNAAVIHARQIVVHNVDNVANINATSRNASGNEDGRLASTEGTHGILTLTLSTISVDGSTGHALVEQEIVKLVGCALAVHENYGAGRRHGVQKVKNSLTLHRWLNCHNFLTNVRMSAASTADTEADVFGGQVCNCQLPQGLGECG